MKQGLSKHELTKVWLCILLMAASAVEAASTKTRGRARPPVTPTATPAATSTSTSTPYDARGCYGKDSSSTGFTQIIGAGFDVVDLGAYREYLDALPSGAKGSVWLGDFDNTTCTWEKSDDWIRSHVSAIAGHPAIAAYYIADEPHVWDCPDAPAQLKARSDLVKSLDPGPPTFAVIEPHSPGNPYTPYVGTVDVIGIDRYPCSYANGCVMSKIDDAIQLAEEAGIPHYWAVIQAFADSYYRMPTADELREEFDHWRASRMEGYLVFSWAYGTDTLANHADLVDVLASENLTATWTPTPVPATPTATPVNATSAPTPTPVLPTPTATSITATATPTRISVLPTSTPTLISTPTSGSSSISARGVYGKDSSASGFDEIVAAGFDLIDRGPYREYLDALPSGAKAFVWLGDYDNTTCTWEKSDDWIRTHVAAIAGHPAIGAYFLVDEPHVWDCPDAPAQLKVRSDLVKSLDPGPPTLAVIEPHSPGNPYTPYVGMVDVIGIDRYPCSYANGCVMSKIDDAINLIEASGAPRWWGVIQAFADSYYRMPTAAELHDEFQHWRNSRMDGYLVFSWDYGTDPLGNHPELIAQLAIENAAGDPAPTPTATRVAATATPLSVAATATPTSPTPTRTPTAVAPTPTRTPTATLPTPTRTPTLTASTPTPAPTSASAVDEVHYTFLGPTSVAFDWRGAAADIRYGTTASYTDTAFASTPSPLPFSSSGPFQEVVLSGLAPGTTYHYSIGGGADRTFHTAPSGSFHFDAMGDVGDSATYPNVATVQSQIAADNPDFVLVIGDLSYGNESGQAAVDRHFNDVMAWSRITPYMPAWGNHEWTHPDLDDLRNYKGRFALPNSHASLGAPSAGCCGEDWSWFDAGGVRFISYPEPYSSGTWPDWQTNAASVFSAAQADPSINFIVTFGHRPAYSTGYHPGDPTLAAILDDFGTKYSKYVLNLNAHSHDYERFVPISHVIHITSSGGGAPIEPPWSSTDSRTAFRAMHLVHLRVDVTSADLQIDAVCGPPTSQDEFTCTLNEIIDSISIARP